MIKGYQIEKLLLEILFMIYFFANLWVLFFKNKLINVIIYAFIFVAHLIKTYVSLGLMASPSVNRKLWNSYHCNLYQPVIDFNPLHLYIRRGPGAISKQKRDCKREREREWNKEQDKKVGILQTNILRQYNTDIQEGIDTEWEGERERGGGGRNWENNEEKRERKLW